MVARLDDRLDAIFSAYDNITIGSRIGGEFSGQIRVGTQGTQTDTFIAGIFGQRAFNGTPVYINSEGRLGTNTSSARFKEEITPMNKASETLYALKPVTFRYKSDKTGTPQFGLLAEQVAEVNPDLVVRDENGKVYTVRYDQVDAMLLNEFLKEHREVQELKKQIAALTGGLQKVSAKLELSKSAPNTVQNSQ
jgi:hypothetical protein